MMDRIVVSSAWAGLIALDFTGVGPFMITQPIVCGPIFGHLLGQTVVGVIIGGIVQLLWLDVTPIGVGIPFDVTAVTILATYWGTLPAHSALSQIILALFIAVPFGFLFKLMDFYARRFNARATRLIDLAPEGRVTWTLSVGIGVSLVLTWLRYAVCYAITIGAGQWVWAKLAYSPKMTTIDRGLTMAVLLLPVAGLGAALELFLSEEPDPRFHGWRPGRWNRRAEDRP